jgi:hypothetical protein
MKQFILLGLMFVFCLNVNGQLKNQVITLKAIPLPDSIVQKRTINRSMEEISKSSNIETKIAPGLIVAGTNIVVNTITKVLKNRISNKTIDYTISISDENFYKIVEDTLVYRGIDFFRLKREKKGKIGLQFDIKPIFSADNQFFKWKITNLDLVEKGFKKNSNNTDIEIKINCKYYKYSNTTISLVSFTEQKITVYSAQEKTGERVYESDWMERISYGTKPKFNSPVYTLSVTVKEMTSVPEIYKEVIKEEDAFRKSLTDLINKITNSSKP